VRRPIPLTPFPMRKGGTEAEGGSALIFQGGREAEGGTVLSFKGEQRRRVARSCLSTLNTGCRGQPCRRKCETHRGFHIQ
jgi:hypothetical protein